MHLVRSPLRVTLGGGGTDLPSYYRKFGGYLISGAIDKYVYCAALRPFEKGGYLKYSEIEVVKRPDEVKHKILREVLSLEESEAYDQIEITTLADIPAGTGLGSSGAFTSALIKCLSLWNGRSISNFQVAESACHIEIDRLQQPVGKQDQFASAIGGITEFTFHKDDSVEYNRLPISGEAISALEDSICMFYTGVTRRANDFLEEQNRRSLQMDNDILDNLHRVKEFAGISRDLLVKGDVLQLGQLMHDQYMQKLKRSAIAYPEQINKAYEAAISNGALGGKLIGAGGGGFLMFICSDRSAVRETMRSHGMEEMRFRFDNLGVHVVLG